MKRRSFIKNTATALTIPTLVNGMAVSTFGASAIAGLNNTDNDKILIMVTLPGGNDGLHTIVPLDQYGNLANARPDIILPENQLLPVTDTLGFNPVLTGFKSLYDNAQMTVVQNVGYPNPDFSHFRSTKIWNTGSPTGEDEANGWLGRHFDVNHPNFPHDYPNPDFPAPFALRMGGFPHPTCQGEIYNYSIAVRNLEGFTSLGSGGQTTTDDTPYGKNLEFMQTAIRQTNQYADAVQDAVSNGYNIGTYPETGFAQGLKNIAHLISGGLKTKVYIIGLGGFDTHVEQGGLEGVHSNLIRVISDGVAAFQADISALGFGEKVLGVTTSEFGRRIFQNAGLGTDHGAAAPMFFFGECLNPGIIGNNPEIPESIEVSDTVAMEYDFRDVLGSVLLDWFEVPEDTVKDIFHDDFQHIPIVNPCGIIDSTVELMALQAIPIDNKEVSVEWKTTNEIDDAYFEIERSRDELNFEKLATVQAKGGRNQETKYVKLDKKPFIGISFYRLKSFDDHGNFSYSNTVRVHIKELSIQQETLYPNPTNDAFTLSFESKKRLTVAIEIQTVLGQTVFTDQYLTKTGLNNYHCDIADFPNGQYWVKLSNLEENYQKILPLTVL